MLNKQIGNNNNNLVVYLLHITKNATFMKKENTIPISCTYSCMYTYLFMFIKYMNKSYFLFQHSN